MTGHTYTEEELAEAVRDAKRSAGLDPSLPHPVAQYHMHLPEDGR